MSAIINTDQYKCYFNQDPTDPCGGPRPAVQGGVVAAMPGGSWLGALISGFLSDILGRKLAIVVGGCIWIVGSIISAAAQNLRKFIGGKDQKESH